MGRPKGSPNKFKHTLPPSLMTEALAQLTLAVGRGEQWAVQEVLKRIPNAMAEPVAGGMQERIMRAKVLETEELAARIEALEEQQHGNQ